MKLGIMQPYLFPYIGYFQLIGTVDLFIIYDDVQYIKGGWINRNRILLNGEPKYITLPLKSDSLRLPINKRVFSLDFDKAKQTVLRQISAAYRRAPYFESTWDLIQRSFQNSNRNVAEFVGATLDLCSKHIGLQTPMTYCSSLGIPHTLTGSSRVISINHFVGGDHYVNPIGGTELYDSAEFTRNRIQLSFIKTRPFQYSQATPSFVPNLSIIDVLMYNSVKDVARLLVEYDLVSGSQELCMTTGQEQNT